MRTKHLILIPGLILFTILIGSAQTNNKFMEIAIQTSAQCELCKERIEGALAFEKGVKSSELNPDNKIIKVVYNTGKITPGKIRNAISKAGYDADNVPADPEAYKKLPACCKKPDDPESKGH